LRKVSLFCTKCGKAFPVDSSNFRCDICNEPLELELVTKGKIREGNILRQSILERYADFFPFKDLNEDISLHEGFTPLIKSKVVSELLDFKSIYFKNEGENPTWAYKDRGTIVALQHALKLGYNKVGTVSCGNMAVSVAAYGSRAGLKTFIFLKENMPDEKLGPVAIYNPISVKVQGFYGDLYDKSLEIGKKNDIYFLNSDIPFRVEGSKTISFEICEQLDFAVPDYIVMPSGSGGNFRGVEKGFRELKNCGLIDKIPKIICVQAAGCSPVYNAFKNNEETIKRVQEAETIALAIANPFPPSGNQVLRRLKENGGTCVAVADELIVEAQRLLALEGIFVQPSSAAPLAAIKKLKEENYLTGNEKIACILTAGGLKVPSALAKHKFQTYDCELENLDQFIKTNFLN